MKKKEKEFLEEKNQLSLCDGQAEVASQFRQSISIFIFEWRKIK